MQYLKKQIYNIYKYFFRSVISRFFDLIYNVDTDLNVLKSSLTLVSKGKDFSDSEDYVPTPIDFLWFIRIFILSKIDNLSSYCFVDIGSGKGRTCFYFSSYFRKICGYELSEKLFEISENNLKQSNILDKSRISFECKDAREIYICENKTIIYFYNPFGLSVMTTFFKNNIDFINNNDCVIVYVNDLHEDFLKNTGLIQFYKVKIFGIGISIFRPNNFHQTKAS